MEQAGPMLKIHISLLRLGGKGLQIQRVFATKAMDCKTRKGEDWLMIKAEMVALLQDTFRG